MRIKTEKGFVLLSEIIRISNSTLDIDTRLEHILENLWVSLELKGIALYLLGPDRGNLYLKAFRGLSFAPTFKLSENHIDDCIQGKRVRLFDNTAYEQELLTDLYGSETKGGGGFFSIIDDRFFYGALVMVLAETDFLTEEDMNILKPVTHEIAGTIRNAQLYSNTREMVDELLTLNDVWKTMSSTIKIDGLLNVTINKAAIALHAVYGIVKLFEGPERGKAGLFYNVYDESMREVLLSFCNEICSKIGESTEAVIVNNLGEKYDEELKRLPHAIDTAMAAPIIERGRKIGCIILFGSENGKKFAEKERRLFSTISSQISAVIDNAMLLEKMETLNREREIIVKELSTLYETSKAVMTTIDLDKLSHIILTAVTIGDGFGFNRAMIFLYNDKTGYIQGMLGVGPDSPEEAWKIWSEIRETGKTLQDVLDKEKFKSRQSKLTEIVKGIRVSIKEQSILGLTVKEKKPFNIKDAPNDPRVNKDLLSRLNCRAFATVPLMSSGRVVGIILVDNVYNEREITADDVRLLTLFANQAGIAIENSTLYRNLENAHRDLKAAQNKLIHSEKLAALGEMAAGVAHEIRNPLVSVGGFARRLARTVEESEDRHYVDIICKEVERLENILNDILIFSREEQVSFEPQDIDGVIEDTLRFFAADFERSSIEVVKELDRELDYVEANYHQLRQIFINLFSNAEHAMKSGGRLRVKSFQSKNEEQDIITVEVSDTGCGIPYDIIGNIFNPFFTTKDTGTGLGLAITHKILTGYGGDIEVMNNEDGGATFIIRLPVTRRKP